jgi:hypothetical protein
MLKITEKLSEKYSTMSTLFVFKKKTRINTNQALGLYMGENPSIFIS